MYPVEHPKHVEVEEELYWLQLGTVLTKQLPLELGVEA